MKNSIFHLNLWLLKSVIIYILLKSHEVILNHYSLNLGEQISLGDIDIRASQN